MKYGSSFEFEADILPDLMYFDVIDGINADLEAHSDAVSAYEALTDAWNTYYDPEITRSELKELEVPVAPGTQVPWTPSGWTGPEFEWWDDQVDGAIQIPIGYGGYLVSMITGAEGDVKNFGATKELTPDTDNGYAITGYPADECSTQYSWIVIASTGAHTDGSTATFDVTATSDVVVFDEPADPVTAPDAWESASYIKVAAASALAGLTLF